MPSVLMQVPREADTKTRYDGQVAPHQNWLLEHFSHAHSFAGRSVEALWAGVNVAADSKIREQVLLKGYLSRAPLWPLHPP